MDSVPSGVVDATSEGVPVSKTDDGVEGTGVVGEVMMVVVEVEVFLSGSETSSILGISGLSGSREVERLAVLFRGDWSSVHREDRP